MMFIVRRFLFFLLAVFFVPNCLAASTEQSTKLWTSVQKKGYISRDKWGYLVQLHVRFGDDSPSFDSGIARLGLGYHSSKTLSFWVGYDFLSKQDVGTIKFSEEQRCWQQLSWEIPTLAPSQLIYRARLEERESTKGSGVAFRLRQKITLKKGNSRMGGTVVPFVADEIFFNLNHPEWISSKTVDQNRLFVGLDIPLGKGRTLKIGYINQFEFRDVNRMNHIIYCSYIFS